MEKVIKKNLIAKKDTKSLTVKLEISKKLEQHLAYLEAISKRPKSFIVKEALIQYLEDAEDTAKYYEEEAKKGSKTHTTETLLEKINLKKITEKDLAKIDRVIAKKIRFGVENDLVKDPYEQGKSLTGK
ncbi:7182_t:CDS:2 [Entrophospora sp. SA101]|nr:7182_t:CDS:2 [Entrophospora sp. SA101]